MEERETFMKILFACGGTAGHINPAIAVATILRRRDPEIQILFAGNPDKMEAQLVPAAGFDFTPIRVEGLQRSLSWTNIKRNLSAARCLLTASGKAKKILREFAPDVVLGTGGYVSGPVLRAAAKMGYPTLTHESNAYPGITTKLLSREVDKVLLAMEKAKDYLPEGKNYIVTGNPLRPEVLEADRAEARKKLGIGERFAVLSFGGSNGAEKVNEALAELMAKTVPTGRFHHIHATGRFGAEEFPQSLRKLGVDPAGEHLDIREYIADMADCLAAADLVICRSGAMTLVELEAAGRAAILIPSPNVAENHQYHNGKVLADEGAALLIQEKDLDGEKLYAMVRELADDPDKLHTLERNARALAITDGAERIVAEILDSTAKR